MSERKRSFRIYNFNPKTRQIDLCQTLKVKPVTNKRFEEIIKEEMSKPINKNACYEILGDYRKNPLGGQDE